MVGFERSLSLTVAAVAFVAGALGSAGAQAPAPRAVPEGFVLPGPPPTNAPSEAPSPTTSGAASPGSAPQANNPAATPSGAPQRTPPSVSGSTITAPSALAPTVGTTRYTNAPAQPGAAHSWPCVQRRTESVTAGQVWSGPPLEEAANVERTTAMRQLVATIAARRVPLAEAEKTVADFVGALPEAERAKTATALFADLLQAMNAERTSVMRGIERYGLRQQELAQKLRAQNAELSDIRQSGDVAKANASQEALLWDTRVFDERRRSLTYVCEVPILIEQRLFALGRAIGGTL